jgi:DNA-binding XRE family transcriptional regulator
MVSGSPRRQGRRRADPSSQPRRARPSHRELRQDRGLTIEGLAAKADLHPTYLSGIERGRYNPSWDKLCDLAAALDIRLSEIVLRAEGFATRG